MRNRFRFIAFAIFGVALVAGGFVGAVVSSTRESRLFAVGVVGGSRPSRT